MKKSTITDFDADNDISELFDSQSVTVPENVRSAIFEQAERHCQNSQNATSTSDESSAFDNGPSYLSSVWTRGFGIAAMLLIAVMITPLLLSEPESSLDSYSPDSAGKINEERVVPMPPVALQAESLSGSTDSLNTSAVVRETAPTDSLSVTASADADSTVAGGTKGLSADAASHDTARLHAKETPSEIASSVSMRSNNAPEKTDTPAALLTQPLAIESADARKVKISAASEPNGARDTIDTAELDEEHAITTYSGADASDSGLPFGRPLSAPPVPNYRVTADAWRKEIVVLIGRGKEQEARDEYRLFGLQYPNQAKRFKPDFSARADEGELLDNK